MRSLHDVSGGPGGGALKGSIGGSVSSDGGLGMWPKVEEGGVI